ncbi:MAG: hypothetical protein ACWGMZ_09330, partial [Thermoguttaceae bacterium]
MIRRPAVGALVLFFAWAWAAPAFASAEEDALVHFRKGTLAYTEGEIDTALAQFQLAFAIKPSFKIRYNIGQCLMELKRLPEAYEMFILYLVEGDDEIEAAR